ncbi:hypothetical protein V1504DRAFT_136973 [Lipomyces starkeyi]
MYSNTETLKIIQCLQAEIPCFLDAPEWQALPLSDSSEYCNSDIALLIAHLDIFSVKIPGLFHLRKVFQTQQRRGPSPLGLFVNVKRKLVDWKSRLDLLIAPPVTAPSDPHDEFCPFILIYPNTSIASLFTSHAAYAIIINEIHGSDEWPRRVKRSVSPSPIPYPQKRIQSQR